MDKVWILSVGSWDALLDLNPKTGNEQNKEQRRGPLELSSIHIRGCVISQSICISGSKRQLVGLEERRRRQAKQSGYTFS